MTAFDWAVCGAMLSLWFAFLFLMCWMDERSLNREGWERYWAEGKEKAELEEQLDALWDDYEDLEEAFDALNRKWGLVRKLTEEDPLCDLCGDDGEICGEIEACPWAEEVDEGEEETGEWKGTWMLTGCRRECGGGEPEPNQNGKVYPPPCRLPTWNRDRSEGTFG